LGRLGTSARQSYVDLNDDIIKGGKESNFTAGLNWYHNRNTRVTRDELDAFLAQSDTRRERVQDRLIELRFQAKDLVTEEEWNAMYAHVDKEKGE